MTGSRDPAPVDAPAPARKPGVAGKRVGIGLLVAVIVVLVIVLDGVLGGKPAFRAAAPGTGLLIAFLSAFAMREFYTLLERRGISSHARLAANASFVILALRALLPAVGVRSDDAAAGALVAVLLVVLAPLASAIGFRSKEGDGDDEARSALDGLAGTALGLVFVHLPMALLLEVRLVPTVLGMDAPVPAGLVLAVMVVVACKVGDSAAYFVGRTIGRIPFCWVSPNKTWEGAVAGVLAGGAAAAALGVAGGLALPEALVLGVMSNLAGQGGDLLESCVKRACDAKDSGQTFGEMGGALDVVDALLLAGPAAYLVHRIVLA
ncbi:MAG: phosphatidate cytidylyltransferase [Planctomycetota bacterium]